MKTIALLTDFALNDNYVGVIKAVILSINPKVNIVDITHNIPAYDIFKGAFLLKNSYKYFPKGSIFVAVVDPGVGSSRKPIIIRTKNYLFVGPDNGILSLAAQEDGIKRIVGIENKRYFLKHVSYTFHARDIFAPVSAHLSKGEGLSLLGKSLKSIKSLDVPKPKTTGALLQGQVVYIDAFGNLVTNIDQDLLLKWAHKKTFIIKIKGKKINSVVKSYKAVKKGAPLAIFDSFKLLEISLNQASAEKYFNAKKGDKVNACQRHQSQ